MFILYADKNQLKSRKGEPLTSGSMNVYQVNFGFSAKWEGLERTAVFKAGSERWSVPLDETGVCSIPWEALQEHGVHLQAGVYGVQGEEIVLPTVWADLGVILEGASPGGSLQPPSGGSSSDEIDHRLLEGRDAPDQHPMEAIAGLAEAMEEIRTAIPRPMTAEELRDILAKGDDGNE